MSGTERDPFAAQKTAYFTQLWQERRHAAKIIREWSTGRILRQIIGIREFWQAPKGARVSEYFQFEDKERSWRNVAEHNLVVAAVARKVGELMHLSSEDLEDLTEAALVHNWGKRIQKEDYLKPITGLVNEGILEPPVAGKLLYEAFDRSDRISERMLRGIGFSPKIRDLALSVGHPSLPKTLEELQKIEKGQEVDWLMLILHWADDVVDNVKPIGLERIKKLEAGLGTHSVYHWMNEYGRKIWDGQSLYEKQLEVGQQVEEVLKAKLGQQQPGLTIPLDQNLTDFIVNQIQSDIAATI